MGKELVVTAGRHETRVALLEDDQLVEVYFQRANEYSLAGSIHKGRVTRVLPGMQSSFVNIGLERDAFLYVTDFFEENEEFADDKPREARSSGGGDDRDRDRDRDRGDRGGRDRGRGDRGGRDRDGRDRDRGDRDRGDRRPIATVGPVAPSYTTEAVAPPPPAPAGEVLLEGERRSERTGDRGMGDRGMGDRGGSDRGGDRGGDRDRRRRRGRGGRGGDRGGSRGIPDSKYASPSDIDEEPRDRDRDEDEGGEAVTPAPGPMAAGAADDFELPLLPGESIRKYRNRPASPARMEPVRTEASERQEDSEEETAVVEARHQVDDEIPPPPPPPPPPAPHVEAAAEEEEEDVEEEEEEAEGLDLDALQAEAEAAVWGQAPVAAEPESKVVEVAAVVVDSEEDEEEEEAEEGPAAEADDDEESDEDGEEGEEVAAAGEESGEDDGPALPITGQTAHLREGGSQRFLEQRSGRRGRRRGRRGRGGDRGDRNGGGDRPAVGTEAAPGLEGEVTEAAAPVADAVAAPPVERTERGDRDRNDRDRNDRDRNDRDRNDRGDRRGGGGGRYERRERPPVPSISELLKEGQEVLVQIAKEPLGQKGARITSHIALPGRYCVYMPTVEHTGVSRKIASDEERQRLKRILNTHRVGMPGGFICRTAGEGKSEDEIAADLSFLYNMWLDIRKKAESKAAPALIYHDLAVVERVLRDQLTDDFKAIWVDNEDLYEQILRFVQRFQPALVNRVKLWTRSQPIFDAFSITSELEKALRSKVWLKSGGYIVINQTEALVAIDINTGKFVGKSNRLEDTIVKTNIEAVKEIVRQIRLRDLGGIIVIDFIDMDERKNRQKVMQALEEAMRVDKAPYKILQFNDFGLVAVTRKRVKQSLERTLCMPCPHCEGAGYIKSVNTVVMEIIEEARKIRAAVEDQKECLLRVHPDVAKELKSAQNSFLEEIEEILGRPVLVTGDVTIHHEKFDLA